MGSGFVEFDARIDVVEPMGVDTMVYFSIRDKQVCARVNPRAARRPQESMRLMADMNRMHLVDPKTSLVI